MRPDVATPSWGRWLGAAALVWLALALPSLRAMLESTMLLHMLVQLPLLAATGAVAAAAWQARAHPPAGWWHASMRGGAAGLLFAGFVLALWMLPRLLDAAVLDARYEAAKFIVLPAAGAAIVAAWPRCPSLARLVVHVEAIAMLLRFGWGYVESPVRLCAVYLQDEQQRVGTALLVAGGIYAVVAAWPVMFGPAPWRRLDRKAAAFADAFGRRPPTR